MLGIVRTFHDVGETQPIEPRLIAERHKVLRPIAQRLNRVLVQVVVAAVRAAALELPIQAG